jgi:hypothetical protein
MDIKTIIREEFPFNFITKFHYNEYYEFLMVAN